MKIELPDHYLPKLIDALDHRYAYSKASNREDTDYRDVAEILREIERKGPGREESAVAPAKKKRA